MSLFNFDDAFERNLERYNNDITSRVVKISAKIKFENKMKRENVEKLITELPLIDESLHIISNGSFDYFTLIPRIIDLSQSCVDNFYFSTWTMSRENAIQIIDLFDRSLFKNINALTGEYFRTRESKVYSFFQSQLIERKQVIVSNKNHSKVTLMKIGENYFVIEGSANFTANPRIEQFILSNSKELFEFHKEWMDKIIKKYI